MVENSDKKPDPAESQGDAGVASASGAEAASPAAAPAAREPRARPAGTDSGGRGEDGGGQKTEFATYPPAEREFPGRRGGGGGGGPGRGPRDRRGGGRFGREEGESRFEERVIKINRCATVVKGGRRFSFSALVVIGDRNGQVGIGFGKANEVPPSVEKAVKDAKKNLFQVPASGGSIPHQTVGRYRSSMVVMIPAADGTGIIAGAVVRALMDCAGIKNILTKSFGSNNPINLAKAAEQALKNLRSREVALSLRGIHQ